MAHLQPLFLSLDAPPSSVFNIRFSTGINGAHVLHFELSFPQRTMSVGRETFLVFFFFPLFVADYF